LAATFILTALAGFNRPTAPPPDDLDDPVHVSGSLLQIQNESQDEPIGISVGEFQIDRYEVTNEQYKEFLDDTGHAAPLGWHKSDYPMGMNSIPVTAVTWADADAYCRWAGKRLPTAEEWQLAAGGSHQKVFPWGDEFAYENCYCNMTQAIWPAPVGSFKDDRSPKGAMDMAGNVSEWTSTRAEFRDLGWYNDKFMVVMGGSFRKSPDLAQTFVRQYLMPMTRKEDLGFRCAL